jgi:hypothetical protein
MVRTRESTFVPPASEPGNPDGNLATANTFRAQADRARKYRMICCLLHAAKAELHKRSMPGHPQDGDGAWCCDTRTEETLNAVRVARKFN